MDGNEFEPLIFPNEPTTPERPAGLNLEGLNEAETQEILDILDSIEDQVDPQILPVLIKQIRKTGASPKRDAAAWYADRGEILLHEDYFIDRKGQTTSPESRRHILLHEVAHALIDAKLVDLAKLQELTASRGTQFDPDWVANKRDSDDQTIERMTELVTSVWLENAGSGTVEEATRQRLRQLSQKKQLELDQDPELMAQFMAETEEIFVLMFHNFVADLNIEKILAQHTSQTPPTYHTPPIPDTIDVGETHEIDKTTFDDIEAMRVLAFAGDFDEDGDEYEVDEYGEYIEPEDREPPRRKKEKTQRKDPPEVESLARHYELTPISRIEYEALMLPEGPLKCMKKIEVEIQKRRKILDAVEDHQKVLALADRAQKQVERTPRNNQRGQKEKTVLDRITFYFSKERKDSDPRVALGGRCYDELRDLEALKREIISRDLVKKVMKFYTEVLGFNQISWTEVMGGRYQRGMVSFQNEKILMDVLDEQTIEILLDYENWGGCLAWAERNTNKKSKEKYILHVEAKTNYQILRILTVKLLAACRAADTEQIDLLKHAYFVVANSLSSRGYLPRVGVSPFLEEEENEESEEEEEGGGWQVLWKKAKKIVARPEKKSSIEDEQSLIDEYLEALLSKIKEVKGKT